MSSSSQQRRELQGPRPPPLRVHKDSHRIRKPPAVPPQQRQPVIIYTVSPKVVHANPSDFMSVVQRLTGASSSSSSLPPPPSSSLPFFPRPSPLSNSALPPAPHLPFPFQLQAAGPPGILQSPIPAVPPSFFSPPTGAGAGGINLFGEPISPTSFHGHDDALPGSSTTGVSAAPHPTQLQYLPAAAAAPSPSPYYSWDLFNNHPDL